MIDLGVLELPQAEEIDELYEPAQFHLRYKAKTEASGEEGGEPTWEERVETFTVHGTLPYGYLVDYWTTPLVRGAGTRNAMIFFRRALINEEEWQRFYDLITDENHSAPKETLTDLLARLLDHYESVDPTPARSGGPKKSRSGQRSTGRGSGRSRSAKARTSR